MSTGVSRAWEAAKETRAQEEECYKALEAAREASRALDEYLDHIATIHAPTKTPATIASGEWYQGYQQLSRAREAGFRAFERCVEKEVNQAP